MKNTKDYSREANVLIELRMSDAMSEDVLDANSDDVLEAVQKYAADIALGPTLSLNLHECAIKLRFDVVARTDAEVYKQLAKVVAVIERHTDLCFESSRSMVEAHGDEAEPTPAEFAAS
jgi:hypothetical protein